MSEHPDTRSGIEQPGFGLLQICLKATRNKMTGEGLSVSVPERRVRDKRALGKLVDDARFADS